MGSDVYDRGERIKELKQQSDKIRDDTLKMYNDPKKSTSEILESWEKQDKIEDKIKRLEEIDKIEKNFEKNINLDEYRNSMVHLMFTNLKELWILKVEKLRITY